MLFGFLLPVLEYYSAVRCLAADTHHKLMNRVVSGASLLTGGLFECDLAHLRSVAVLYVHTKSRAPSLLYMSRMWRCVLHVVLWSHISTLMRLLAAEPHSTAGLLFPFQYLCGTILVTPNSMVWGWQVSRAGPMTFYFPWCSLLFCLLQFSLSLLSFYGLVLWGWGLRTDRVLITLSQPCTANIF